MLTISRFQGLVILFFFLLMTNNEARASFPEKPIRFICTTAPGGSLDVMMRAMAKMLSEELKTPIYVENKPGATGSLAMSSALALPADGYTVVSASGSTSFMLAEGKANFTENDFIFITGLQSEPSAIAVPKSSPYKSLADFIEAVKSNPAKINVGGYATAGFHQFVYYRLQQLANYRGIWIPFNNGNQAVLGLMGGHIDAAVITPSSALGQLQSGDIRLLAISTANRDQFFPSVPTFKEQGYELVENLWRGMLVKKGTPAEVLDVFSKSISKVESSPAWKKFMLENAQSSMNLSVEKMQQHVKTEINSRKIFLKSMGL
ncbi:MAG: tripartite tricarboxylate transporter substrate binding protein [Betaproteobacteria bacterium]|jgi:tripartite-type tricarboxylate transporter receptor subunit TctC